MDRVSGRPPTTASDRLTAIAAWLQLLHPDPAAVFEVRSPKCPDRKGGSYTSTWSGYFDRGHVSEAAAAILALDTDQQPPGIYVTMNAITPALLARAVNRLRPKAEATTTDDQVVARRWLLLDLDPVRPAGLSATDDEQAAALQLATTITTTLAGEGWPRPVVARSGNGAYLLYRVDLPNDDPTRVLMQDLLRGLAARFDTDRVTVDQSTFNAARIIKVMGTTARKGDALVNVAGQADRPHRVAGVVEVPADLQVVPREALEAVRLAAPGPVAPSRQKPTGTAAASGGFDRIDTTPDGVQRYLEGHGVLVRRQQADGAYTSLILDRCPVRSDVEDRTGTSLAVRVAADGGISYHNLHNRGVGLTWLDVREALEPGYRAWRDRWQGQTSTRAKGPADENTGSQGPDAAPPVEAPQTLAADLQRAGAWLPAQHGRQYLGLVTPTLPTLRDATLGLRGLMLLASMPGIGKTSLGLQLGVDVAAHHVPGHPLGAAVFVFFSFEMSRLSMTLRLLARAAGIPWRTLVLGDANEPPDHLDGLRFTGYHRDNYRRGRQDLEALADRIVLIDGDDVEGGRIPAPADWMLSRIATVKAQAGVERAFVLIDNLQALPVPHDPLGNPWRTDLDRDRFVISQLLTVARQSPTDALLVISEQNKAGFGQRDLETVLGSGRAVYSPDAVLFLASNPQADDVPTTPDQTEVDLVVSKARDGMRQGPIPLTFHHAESRYTEADRRPFTRKRAARSDGKR